MSEQPASVSTGPTSLDDVPGAGGATVLLLDPPPRAGQLTLGWRIATAFCWLGVVLAFASVWNVSVQLGLSTWWLGPRGEPMPRLLQFGPFLPSILMLLGTINNLRRLGWFGLAAATVLAGVGLGDLGRVTSIAVVELAIAAAAAVFSVASLTGAYRAPADAA